MELHRHDNYTPGAGRGRTVTVSAPPAHAGVGEALRRAYCEVREDVPRDFAMLLERLR